MKSMKKGLEKSLKKVQKALMVGLVAIAIVLQISVEIQAVRNGSVSSDTIRAIGRKKRDKLEAAKMDTQQLKGRLLAIRNNKGIDAQAREYKVLARQLASDGVRYEGALKKSPKILSEFISNLKPVAHNIAITRKPRDKKSLDSLLARLTTIQCQVREQDKKREMARLEKIEAARHERLKVAETARKAEQLTEMVAALQAEREQILAEKMALAQSSESRLAEITQSSAAQLAKIMQKNAAQVAEHQSMIDAKKSELARVQQALASAESANNDLIVAMEFQAKEQKNACGLQLSELQKNLYVEKQQALEVAIQKAEQEKSQMRSKAALQKAELKGMLVAVRDERDRMKVEQESRVQMAQAQTAQLKNQLVALRRDKDKIVAEKEKIIQEKELLVQANQAEVSKRDHALKTLRAELDTAKKGAVDSQMAKASRKKKTQLVKLPKTEVAHNTVQVATGN